MRKRKAAGEAKGVMAVEFTRRLFTVDDYYRMAAAGVFAEDERVELIEGEIIEMSPAGSRHAGGIKKINALLGERMGNTPLIISVQDPIRLDDGTEPQPDIAVLRWRDDYYVGSHPTPDDVLLVIEVADSSLVMDLVTKASSYARAGIPEYWVFDLVKNEMVVHAQPENDLYIEVRRVPPDESVSLRACPSIAISFSEVFG